MRSNSTSRQKSKALEDSDRKFDDCVTKSSKHVHTGGIISPCFGIRYWKTSEPRKENYFSVVLETWRVLLQFSGLFQNHLKSSDNGGHYVFYRALLTFVCSSRTSRPGHFACGEEASISGLGSFGETCHRLNHGVQSSLT